MIKVRNKDKLYRKKYTLLICIGIFFLLILVGYIFLHFNYQKNKIIELNKEGLQTLANEKASEVDRFFNYQREKLEIIGSMNVFKEALLHSNDTSKIDIANIRIEELKVNIPGISLISNEGIVVTGDVDLPGTDYGEHPYFVAKRKDITFTEYYDPLRKNDYYAIIGPIYNSNNKSEIIGRIAFDITLEDISNIFVETFDTETNEAYLINENGLLLSESEYIGKGNKNGVLIQEVKSEGAEECLEHLRMLKQEGFLEEHEEEAFQYINYMGNEVYGAHAYVRAIDGCVIAEKGIEEISKQSLTGYVVNEIIRKEVNNE